MIISMLWSTKLSNLSNRFRSSLLARLMQRFDGSAVVGGVFG